MMASVVETRATDLTGPMARTVEGRAERRSFADVAREHLDRLYGFCVRLTNDPSDADDLVQETLLRGMRAYDDLR
jgi:DNA-directed RNA polymerase specialized sigma24 family protein